MIYTSYYSKAKKLGDNYVKVGISRFPPKNIINNYNLAPSVELFNDCKNNYITDREFILRYRNEVIWYLDEFIQAIKPFNDNKYNHIVLCCYERLGLCHRHILAELLRQRGINIKEI